MKEKTLSRRNQIVQIITPKDGSKKKIYHDKSWPAMNPKQVWDYLNKTERPKTPEKRLKRQQDWEAKQKLKTTINEKENSINRTISNAHGISTSSGTSWLV